MSAKTKYSDEPIKAGKPVSHFLPSPEELVLKEDTVKVTISLTKDSVDFLQETCKEIWHPISADDSALIGRLCAGAQEIDPRDVHRTR